MNILGINAVYHESAAALLVDSELVAAAEEERFNRVKHGKHPTVDNPHVFPERAIRFCLDHAGLRTRDIDHVAYSFEPKLRRKEYRAEWWPDPRRAAILIIDGIGEVACSTPLRCLPLTWTDECEPYAENVCERIRGRSGDSRMPAEGRLAARST